jgi:hypothetical protein
MIFPDKITHGSTVILITVFLSFTAIVADPIIECDTPTVNAGSIRENEVKRIRHVFTIKNTGDKPLKIEQVKPG